MGTDKKLKIEIDFGEDDYYHIKVNGADLKMCSSYGELAECIGSLIKSSCKRKTEIGYL